MKTDLLLLFLLPFLAACGGETANKDMAGPAPKKGAAPAVPDGRPAVYLEGIYATSSTPDKEVYDLFDDDPNTGWQTAEGAGPDEGIMLYFFNALPLGAVQVAAAEGSYHGDGDFVEVYVNGVPVETGKPGDTIPLGDKPVKALYLRFVGTGLELKIKRNVDGADVVYETFPADAHIGLTALTLYDDHGKEMRIVPPKRVRGTIAASSTLEPEAAYSAANLFDARKEFVWAEGSKQTAGVGDSIRFGFMEDVNITAIQIWNGYQRSDDHYASNARVRDFRFGVAKGPAATYTLRDTRAGQRIELRTPAKGRQFDFHIESIYPGRKYKDLVISEIVFFDGDIPFVLSSEMHRQYTTELHRKAITSPLSRVLDRRISNKVEEMEVTTDQSLILRSDGTFVLYSSDILPNDTESLTLADGNWELLRSDAAGAVIKVFGKWNNVSDFIELYQGKTTRDVTRIFSDELVLEANTIRGKKMIGTFYIR
ncbi:MAG: hypothetical protein R2791_06185 [Saprospiraceae bacterium]